MFDSDILGAKGGGCMLGRQAHTGFDTIQHHFVLIVAEIWYRFC